MNQARPNGKPTQPTQAADGNYNVQAINSVVNVTYPHGGAPEGAELEAFEWQGLLEPALVSILDTSGPTPRKVANAVLIDSLTVATAEITGLRDDPRHLVAHLAPTSQSGCVRVTKQKSGALSFTLDEPLGAEGSKPPARPLWNQKLREGDRLVGLVPVDPLRAPIEFNLTVVSDGNGGWITQGISGLPSGCDPSGLPVINLLTGGVVGLLAAQRGGGHRVVAVDVTGRPEDASELWRHALTSEQLKEGGWPWPPRRLREYLTVLSEHCSNHPYPVAVFDIPPPPLDTVHVKQTTISVGSSRGGSEYISGLAEPIESVLAGGLLVGPPGGGKSSALRRLCAERAHRILAGELGRVPILIHASEIDLNLPLSESVAKALNRALFRSEPVLDPGFFSNAPAPGWQWHYFVDGLDELLDRDARGALISKIVAALGPGAPDRVTVGTRPLPPSEIQELLKHRLSNRAWTIQSLSSGEVREVIRGWFNALGLDEVERRVAGLVFEMRQSGADDLMTNPLMLTMVCQLYYRDPTMGPPSGRTELYDRYFEALRERFFDSDSRVYEHIRRRLERYGEDATAWGGRVAESAHGALATVALRWLRDDVAPTASEFEHALPPAPHHIPARSSSSLVGEIAARTGVADISGSELEFIHQTLAEHLAAWALRINADASRTSLEILASGSSGLATNVSLLRFVANHWLATEDFRSWLTSELVARRVATLGLIAQLVWDGNAIPAPLERQLSASIFEQLDLLDTDSSVLIDALRVLADVATQVELNDALARVAVGAYPPDSRAWALVALAAQSHGNTRDGLRKSIPNADQVDLAASIVADFVAAGSYDFSSPPSIEAILDVARALHAGVEGNLRQLVPAIFSRGRRADNIERLRRTIRAHHAKADVSIVEQAFVVADGAHSGRLGRNGEPYIAYPLAVAQILADLGLPPHAIAASLLYDVVRVGKLGVDALTTDFGDEVARLVDGVLEIDKVVYAEGANAGTVRRMLISMSSDLRILTIRVADRLQSARTSGFLPPETARRSATEALEVYAPLAHGLGIIAIKAELEDLSFAILHPGLYAEITDLIEQRFPQRERYLDEVIKTVQGELSQLRIRGDVSARAKSVYSLYQKMTVRGREFDDIHDLIGVRVLVGNVRDCYATLGAVHARWTPLPGKFKDFIATPKFNMYQAIHTTVLGPGGRTVEVQIRTHEMHQHAVADEARNALGMPATDRRSVGLGWISEPSPRISAPGDFLSAMREDLGADGVYVFTPNGRVIGLASHATPIDFAYAVHTQVGHRAIGAKVNGRLVPLSSEIESGDVVEVLLSTDPDAGPNPEWKQIVRTTHARSHINRWFSARSRLRAIQEGMSAVAATLAIGADELADARWSSEVDALARGMGYHEPVALYLAVGRNAVSARVIARRVARQFARRSDLAVGVKPATTSILSRANAARGSEIPAQAECCYPLPGDEVLSVTSPASKVLHRSDCKIALAQPSARKLQGSVWEPAESSRALRVRIRVEGLNRPGLADDVIQALQSRQLVNVLSATQFDSMDRLALTEFVFEVSHPGAVDRAIAVARRVDGVFEVRRGLE